MKAEHLAHGAVPGVISARPTSCRIRTSPKEFPGKIDTSTPYVIAKVVSRLEMDSHWAQARSVRALVAEREVKEKLET